MDNKYIGTKINVLDHGHVTLVDFMGTDSSIVQAARVSYGPGTKSVSEDKQLIRYMMRHKHTSVFEQVVFKFHVKAPIFVFRQWHRHRTLSLNELSARYSVMKDECYIPAPEHICSQSNTNKQGRGNQLTEHQAEEIRGRLLTGQEEAFTDYQQFINVGLARELARLNLPVSTYSEMYFTQNLHNLFHFLKLRMDAHAQYEIRVYANAIYELIKPIVPISCEAFEDYVLNAVTFSKEEISLLQAFLNKEEIKETLKLSKEEFDTRLSKREIDEFKQKLGI